MAKYRKLGRTSSQRKALLRNQVTALLNNGKIVTTEAKAKEIRKIAEGLIALAVKEKDNFEEVTVKAKVARKDKFPKIVRFPVKYIVFHIFKIVNGIDLANMKIFPQSNTFVIWHSCHLRSYEY